MTTRRDVLALVAAGATAPAWAAAARAFPSATPGRDWRTTVAAQPDGATLVGNPAAAIKLEEWLSYTCPHCAHFTAEAEETLEAAIAAGRLSATFHPAVRDGFDMAATLLATNAGPRFLAVHKGIYAQQAAWAGRAGTLDRAALAKLAPPQQLRRVADGIGLTAIVQGLGVPKPTIDTAFVPARIQRIADATKASWAAITGTPTFAVNGTRVSGSDWAALKPALAAAGLS